MATEEFTFPIADTTNSPIDSPPLWSLSPVASPSPAYEDSRKVYDIPGKITEKLNQSQRKSCSFIEASLIKRLRMNKEDYQQEEKMDILWEDLNDEVYKNNQGSKIIGKLRSYSRRRSNDIVEFGCVPTSFMLSKSNTKKGGSTGLTKSTKTPSVIVVMKALRKFFALHQSQQSAKKGSW